MSNIKFSGLKGQALEIDHEDIPSIKEFRDVIPDQYFKSNTKTSLSYLSQSALIQSIVFAIGLSIPFTPKMIPIWIIYSLISGEPSKSLPHPSENSVRIKASAATIPAICSRNHLSQWVVV